MSKSFAYHHPPHSIATRSLDTPWGEFSIIINIIIIIITIQLLVLVRQVSVVEWTLLNECDSNVNSQPIWHKYLLLLPPRHRRRHLNCLYVYATSVWGEGSPVPEKGLPCHPIKSYPGPVTQIFNWPVPREQPSPWSRDNLRYGINRQVASEGFGRLLVDYGTVNNLCN